MIEQGLILLLAICLTLVIIGVSRLKKQLKDEKSAFKTLTYSFDELVEFKTFLEKQAIIVNQSLTKVHATIASRNEKINSLKTILIQSSEKEIILKATIKKYELTTKTMVRTIEEKNNVLYGFNEEIVRQENRYEQLNKLLNEKDEDYVELLFKFDKVQKEFTELTSQFNSEITNYRDSILEYQRTQKNDRAKIARDASMYASRAETIKWNKLKRKERDEKYTELISIHDKLVLEHHKLELKLKRKAPVKKVAQSPFPI
jgi:chromosome segregation ATPase